MASLRKELALHNHCDSRPTSFPFELQSEHKQIKSHTHSYKISIRIQRTFHQIHAPSIHISGHELQPLCKLNAKSCLTSNWQPNFSLCLRENLISSCYILVTSCQLITTNLKNNYTNLRKGDSWGKVPLCSQFLCVTAFGTEEVSQRKHMFVAGCPQFLYSCVCAKKIPVEKLHLFESILPVCNARSF